MTVSEELRRLREGAPPPTRAVGAGLVTFSAVAAGDADLVLARVKEVMATVLETEHAGETTAAWRDVLPAWFIARFQATPSDTEIDRWLREWRNMAPLEKERASRQQWTLQSWIELMNPSERQWHWWDSRTDGSDVAQVIVAVDGMPAGLGTLDFLLYASGATAVSNDG